MKAVLRFVFLSGLSACLSLTDVFAQAANITGWKHADNIYCSTEASDTIFGESPSGKPFFFNGVSYTTSPALVRIADGEAIFYPAIAGVGTHEIKYGNIGNNEVIVNVTVVAIPPITVSPFATVCANVPAFSLFNADSSNVSPKNGIFSGPGVNGAGFFNPAAAGAGTHIINYTVTAGGCTSTTGRSLTVLPIPAVSVNPFSPVCEGSSVITLTQGFPAGGTYSGPGTDAAGNFNCLITGIGSFPITYVYSNGTCSSSAMRDIIVSAGPTASLSGLGNQYCPADAPVTITGNPAMPPGIFSGSGITDNNNGTAVFSPPASGLGLHQINYIYTNVNGCSDTASQNVQVGTIVTLGGLAANYCVNSTNVAISGNPVGGSFGVIAGLTDNGNGTGVFSPSTAGVGIHTVSYSYTDGNGCINQVSQQVRVYGLPVPAILNLASEYCVNAPFINISGNYAPSGTFSGAATVDNGNGTARFTPSNLLPGGPYNITYNYQDAISGCQASVTSQVMLNAIPAAVLTVSASVCYGDPATLSVSLTGNGPFNLSYTDGSGTYNAMNVPGPVYNTQVYPADTTTYTLVNVNDSKGCAVSGASNATIAVLPETGILTQPASQTVCPGSNVHFTVGATGVNLQYQWVKDGVNLIGANNATLAINNAQPADIGTYYCRVTGDCGPVISSNDAMLLFWSPVVLVADPADAHECAGESINMNVLVTGSNLVYQWFKDNAALQDTSNYTGSSTNNLFISNLSQTNSGNYHARITGSCGTVVSNPGALEVDRNIIINTQPESAEICEGNNASFSVIATGDNISYQWQLNNMDIPGETSATVAVPNASVADEGFYRCRISSTCGNMVFSNVVTLTVLTYPVISANPVKVSRCEGDNAIMSVTASGTAITYQWRKNGINLLNNAKINGATTSTLTINNIAGADIGNYSCVITNTCGSLSSTPASLSVDTSLAILTQPVSINACLNTNQFFSITASGNNITYQWYKNGIAIPGATNPGLVINNIGLADAAQYSCMVSNTCGKTVASDPAELTIENALVISQQPLDVETCVDNNALFAIQVPGIGFTYQWEYNGVILAEGGNISGTQTNTLNIQKAELINDGVYNCLVTGLCGSERSIPASLVVHDSLGTIVQPQNLIVCEGNNAQFSTQADGAVNYQWQKDEVNIAGKNSPTLILNNVAATDSGVYRCLLFSLCDTMATDGALLTVKTSPQITVQPLPSVICEGQQVQFETKATGSDLSWQWTRDGSDLTDGNGISGTNMQTLVINPAELSDAGVYSARIIGYCGSVTTGTVMLSVTPAPQIVAHPQAVTTCENLSAAFTVVIAGTVIYQWQKDNIDLPGQTGASLNLFNVSAADEGIYRCKITGSCGVLFSNGALLTVNRNIVITQQPAGSTLCEGNLASIQVVASGTGLSYQWKHDGVNATDNISTSGSTSAGLVINPAGINDAGIYHCEITGACGSLTSSAATININENTIITSQPDPVITCSGLSASFSIQATGSGITLQWQKDGVDIPGATNATYSIVAVTPANSGLYRCILTGPCGQVFSEAAMLTVDEPPTIQIQPPLSINICRDDELTVGTSVQGSNINYQWYFNGTPLSDNALISGSTASILIINPVSELNEGVYFCVISNSCSSSVTVGTQVTVNNPAVVTEQPKNTSSCTGEDISLTVLATGDNLSYQWQKGSTILAGATNPVLTINNIALTDSGTYQCVITSTCGSITSDAARLSVSGFLAITANPPALLTPCEETMISLHVSVSGIPLSYQWRKNGIDLINDVHISGSQSPNLQITDIMGSDAGIYTCVVSNSCNVVTTPVTLMDVQHKPVIVFHPADYSVTDGGNASFSVTASGDNLSWQWIFGGSPLSDGGTISGSSTGTLVLTGVSVVNQGAYHAEVTGTCGSAVSNPASLSLLTSSVISVQPSGAVKCEGETVSISLVTSGSGHTYQWKKNGILLTDNIRITGSQQAALTISDLVPGDAASYNCLVDGIENSIPAQLFVNRLTAISAVSGMADLCLNEGIAMLVTASGDLLTYAWYKDGVMLLDDAEINGSATANMGISPVNTTHSGSYVCHVSGVCGNAVSDPQIVTVSVPAAITVQPSDITLCEGQNANLTITATGTNLSYQWLKNGVNLSDDARITGSKSLVLNIANTTGADAGAYSCTVSGNCNTVYSTVAQLSVNPIVAIAQQPLSAGRCLNDLVTFVVVTNTGNAGFQWQKNGVNLNDNAFITGSATGVLQITNLQPADIGTYQCVITGPCNVVTTNACLLDVYSKPVITTQPAGGIICEGGSHSFEVTANGSSLTYQWMKDGVVISDGAGFSGTNSPTLQVTGAAINKSGVYHCVVTGICLSEVSASAVLTVNTVTTITSQPESKQLCNGNDLTLVTAATGTANSWQWQKDNNPIADGGNISGATTPVIHISNITQAESGSYRCIVTGACNSIATLSASVVISAAPAITMQPTGATVCENANVLLQTSATGSNLSFSWKRSGIAVIDTGNISGSSSSDLLIQNITQASAGIYTCEVYNSCGSFNSNPAAMVVNQPGTITSQPASQQVCLGGQAAFFVNTTGTNLNYQWEFAGAPLADGANISGSQTRVLTISNTTVTENGTYRCVITDGCGLVINSDPATLTVYEPVVISSVPQGDTLCAGQSFTLTITASGSNPVYQWFKNGAVLTDMGGITGTNTSTLILNNLTTAMAGYYSCQLTGSCGSVVTPSIPVLVDEPVSITDQPDNLTLCTGEPALFSITAYGDSLTYQWVKDGNPLTDGPGINGSNSSLLLLTGVAAGDAGSYHCVLTGACGILNSQPALLTVNVYPGAAGLITGATVVCQGTTGVIYVVPPIPDAVSYSWNLPPGMVITSGNNTRQITVSFSENESGGPVSVSGINGCGSGPSSPILSVTANPLPVAYAGESIGICADAGILTAYTPNAPATGMWQVINGPAVVDQPAQATTAISNLRNGDNQFGWTVTLNGCSVTDTVTIRNNIVVVEAGPDTSICDHIYAFKALAPSSGIGQWSIVSGAGYNINRYDPNSVVSGLAKGINIFKWSVNNNGCVSHDTVKITNNLPSESDAGPNQYIQADNTNLNANNPSIGTGEWKLLNGSAIISDPTAYNTLVTGLGQGKNIFEWLINHQGCVSSDTVIIENILTDSTDAGPNQVICSSSVRLGAKNPYPGYGEWSVKRGSATFADNSIYNTYAYNLAQGENVLVWSAYLNGITSDSVIIINDLPTAANAGVNLSICADSSSLNANLPYIGTGLWSIVSGSGVFNNNGSNITTVRNLSHGNNNFKWTITNGTCSSSSIVTIVNNAPSIAEAGFDAVTCEDTMVLNPGIPTFGTGEWSVFSGSAKFKGNLAYDLGRDDNHLVYNVRNAGCYSRDTVIITSHKPTTARSGADQSICMDSALMVANTPVTGTGIWTLQSGAAAITDITNPNTQVKNLGGGENLFRWTISYQGCTSYDDVVISNDFVPAYAGTDKVLCANRTTLEANDPGYSQGYWTITGGSTGANILDPYAANSVIENLGQGANILRWTISKNSCISYDEVTIHNNLPTKAFAGEDLYLCNDEATLRANTITVGLGTWSILSGSGNISDIQDQFATITDMGTGINILRWTSENAGCITTDEVIISNNLPVDVYGGLDQALCDDSTSLYANPPSLGTGTWSVILGSAVFADPHLYSTRITNLGNGSNRLKWTIATTGCSVTDTIVITNNLPTVAIAGSDFPVCNSRGHLSANTPLYGIGEWSLVSGAGTIANANAPLTTITNLALGNNLLNWTITNQNCTSSDDLMIINNSPTVADAGENAEVCGETAILYANSPTVGYGYWEVISGTGIFTDSLSFNSSINGLNFGENTLRWTTKNGTCLTIDEITITNNLAYVYAGEDQVVYENEAVLSGNNPGNGTSEWLLLAGAGTITSTGSFTTPVTSLGAGLNTFEWTITNGICTARDQVIIHFKVMPVTGFITDQAEGCPGLTVSFVNTTRFGTTYRWELGDGTMSTLVNPTYTYDYPGQYHVILTAFGPDNKTVTSDTTIIVHKPPIAEFQFAPDTAFVGKPMRCYDYSYAADIYSWNFGDNQESNESNPLHYYETSGEFTITLIVTSDDNCTDTVSYSITVVDDGALIFPNAFTPSQNGSNGGIYTENDRSNDVFHPYHENVAEFHMEIYSRWGVLLFETDDINIGWDGYYKGVLLAKDVYVWKANGKYASGSEFMKTGTVLLIK